MPMTDRELLQRTAEIAADFLATLPDRPVALGTSAESLRASLGGPLPESGEPSLEIVERLAVAAEPGLIASAGPRYFGFVIGGSHPATVAADWLTSTWDQNAGLYATGPAASVVEEVAASWLLDLLRLPDSASVGLTTGCSAANFTALAAARHSLLAASGWDVEERGLYGAPEMHVVIGAEAHVTILTALQSLGLGRGRVHRAETDEQGRMRPESLRAVLASLDGPVLVCAQAGNVNTGAFDPIDTIADVVGGRGGSTWLHVDGAFGLWASAVPRLRSLVAGIERADSWATDAHKWLNVPYDSGIVIVRDPVAHKAAMTTSAAYLVQTDGARRDPFDWVPEFSRRARGFTVYAALRAFGRQGVCELIDRCCRIAARMAEGLAAEPGVKVLADVVLNQILVRFGDDDALTRDVIARVQDDGTCWLGGTTWHGMAAMRISVSNWSTTEEDADRSVAAILRCYREASAAASR